MSSSGAIKTGMRSSLKAVLGHLSGLLTRCVITTSDDGMVRLWDAGTGAKFSVLGVHTSWVNHVAFDPSRTRIVTASTDQTAQIIDLFPSTKALTDHARSVVSRELTLCERKR